MSSLSRSPLERRAETFVERRYRSVDRDSRLSRFAGDLFNLNLKERAKRVERESRQRLQKSRPTGVGFGEDDNYGPDNSWSSQDTIKDTPVPGYYKSYKSF